jgi:cold shock CspA family protein
MEDGEEVQLGIVAEFNTGLRHGWIDKCERTGRVFYRPQEVIGAQPAIGSPVSFRIKWGVDARGRTRPYAANVTRLCYANYGPGDALQEVEQPAEDAVRDGDDGVRRGVVSQFDAAKGFGHILQSDGRHLFVHTTNVQGGVMLAAGDRVEFEVGTAADSKGAARWQAVRVKRCTTPIN